MQLASFSAILVPEVITMSEKLIKDIRLMELDEPLQMLLVEENLLEERGNG